MGALQKLGHARSHTGRCDSLYLRDNHTVDDKWILLDPSQQRGLVHTGRQNRSALRMLQRSSNQEDAIVYALLYPLPVSCHPLTRLTFIVSKPKKNDVHDDSLIFGFRGRHSLCRLGLLFNAFGLK